MYKYNNMINDILNKYKNEINKINIIRTLKNKEKLFIPIKNQPQDLKFINIKILDKSLINNNFMIINIQFYVNKYCGVNVITSLNLIKYDNGFIDDFVHKYKFKYKKYLTYECKEINNLDELIKTFINYNLHNL